MKYINDNDTKDDLHNPVGTGMIDWQNFDRLIRENEIQSSVLIEVKGYENQKKSLEYMKQREIYPMHCETV